MKKDTGPVLYNLSVLIPASILYKSTAGHYRPVSYPDGPITARCRFIKNVYCDIVLVYFVVYIKDNNNNNNNAFSHC